jgi:hypothetical protein
MKPRTRITILAAVILVGCENTPFNPYGKTQQNECHPEMWLNEEVINTPELIAYQEACKAARLNGARP